MIEPILIKSIAKSDLELVNSRIMHIDNILLCLRLHLYGKLLFGNILGSKLIIVQFEEANGLFEVGDTMLNCSDQVLVGFLWVLKVIFLSLFATVDKEQLVHRLSISHIGSSSQMLNSLFNILRYSESLMVKNTDPMASHTVSLFSTHHVILGSMLALLFASCFLLLVETWLRHHLASRSVIQFS